MLVCMVCDDDSRYIYLQLFLEFHHDDDGIFHEPEDDRWNSSQIKLLVDFLKKQSFGR